MITPDDIRARIATLTQEREALLANVNAYNGAIQDCEYWLAQLEAIPEAAPLPTELPPAED